MVKLNDNICPVCQGQLKYYDKVTRISKGKFGVSTQIKVRRFRCTKCGSIHREIPEVLYPYKHYENEVYRKFFWLLDSLRS